MQDVEIVMDLHLCGLKAIFQVVLQVWSKSRSCCKRRQSEGEEIKPKHLQSSAYSKADDMEMDRSKSLMYVEGQELYPRGPVM